MRTNSASRYFTATILFLTVVFPFNHTFAIEPVELAKLLAGDANGFENFGISVSIDGDTAVVGANSEWDSFRAGAAYVFVRSGNTWTEQAKLYPSDGAEGDAFGISVSVNGDTAVIGAYHDDSNSGSAYVFVRNGSTWTEQAKLTASDGDVADWFGASVNLAGDTVVVSAMKDDSNGDDSGSTYVFVRNGSTWTEQAKLTASDGDAGDEFGTSVDIVGETVVIGAFNDDDNGIDSGSAYIFVRNGSAWSEQAKLTASDGDVGDGFGISVHMDAETAVIGAAGAVNINGEGAGAVYVFARDGSTWSQQAKLTASDGKAGDGFGGAVSVDGILMVVGAAMDDTYGSSYIFLRSGDTWTEQAKLAAIDGESFELYGIAVSVDGVSAVIGAPGDNDGGTGSGAAFMFSLASTATPAGEAIVVEPLPVDEGGHPVENGPGVSIIFEKIVESGDTTVILTEPGPDTALAPSGLRITGMIDGPVLLDIKTTATPADGSTIEICIDYSAFVLTEDPSGLILLHHTNETWRDITSSNDSVNMVICGIADSLSYFAIVEGNVIFRDGFEPGSQ